MTDQQRDQRGLRRRWLSVILATVLLLASFLMFVWAATAASGEETVFAGGLIGIGLGLVPAVFAVAAWVSGNPHALGATLFASGLWFAATLILAFISLPVALVAGYGAGGVVAFRLRENNSRRTRIIAVAICVLYAWAMLRFSTALGLFAGAPLPFVAIALADVYEERAAEDPEGISP